LREAHRLSENIFNFPLQSGARSSHPTPLVQQEQLDPVSVDQGAAEADAELEAVFQRRQSSCGSEKAVGGIEDERSIFTVGPQAEREVKLGVVGDRRRLDLAVQPELGELPLQPSQLGDCEGALVGVVAARIEEREHRGLPCEELRECRASAVLVLQLHAGEHIWLGMDLLNDRPGGFRVVTTTRWGRRLGFLAQSNIPA
jgi:hypothetical protein